MHFQGHSMEFQKIYVYSKIHAWCSMVIWHPIVLNHQMECSFNVLCHCDCRKNWENFLSVKLLLFSYHAILTYVLGAQKNRLIVKKMQLWPLLCTRSRLRQLHWSYGPLCMDCLCIANISLRGMMHACSAFIWKCHLYLLLATFQFTRWFWSWTGRFGYKVFGNPKMLF